MAASSSIAPDATQRPRRSTERLWGGHFSWSSISQLSPELLDQARERLAVLAGLLAGLGISGVLVLKWGPIPAPYAPRALSFNLGPLVLLTGVSLVVSGIAMCRGLCKGRITPLGLIYEVFVCWTISVFSARASVLAFGHLPMLTWTEPAMILFPLLIPSPPAKALAAGLLSAASRPFSVAYLASLGEVTSTPLAYLSMSISPIIALVLGAVGSKLIYTISRDVSAAREMGSYRLEALLGRGGMGEVWRATHRMLARPAAVKLIRPEVLGNKNAEASMAMLERFEREAQVTANLRSHHTVELYDFGRSDDGTFYYVMELLDGLDLNTLIKRYGPVPPERAVYLLRQLCHSLDEAHASGLVHRDIKPANIFICRNGLDFDCVKVLDFGLVKNNLNGQSEISLTGAGALVGTPAFMAPEMVKGGNVDARTDIYAVGCLAYWLISGRLVFERKNPMATALAHASEDPTRLSLLAEETLPDGLEAVIERCLAKKPEERYATAGQLNDDLAAVTLMKPWGGQRARRWWESHNPSTGGTVASVTLQ